MTAAKGAEKMTTKYEYRLENLQIDIKKILGEPEKSATRKLQEQLDEMGQEGWRLCGVNGQQYYFIREK
jgi:hypothetical protein